MNCPRSDRRARRFHTLSLRLARRVGFIYLPSVYAIEKPGYIPSWYCSEKGLVCLAFKLAVGSERPCRKQSGQRRPTLTSTCQIRRKPTSLPESTRLPPANLILRRPLVCCIQYMGAYRNAFASLFVRQTRRGPTDSHEPACPHPTQVHPPPPKESTYTDENPASVPLPEPNVSHWSARRVASPA